MPEVTTLNAIVKQKRDTSANWKLNNPVLPNGVFGIEHTEDGKTKLKAGDGETAWNDLEYLSGGGSGGGGIHLTYEEYITLFNTDGLDPDTIYEVSLTEDQYQELTDTDKIPSDESGITVHFYTDDEEEVPITPSTGGGSVYNENLLRNSNFKINRRGLLEYTSTESVNEYCVDGWIFDCIGDGGGSLTVLSDGGVSIEAPDSTYFGVFQKLENPLNIGEVYTVSAKINGNIYSAQITGGSYNGDGIKLENSDYYIFYTIIHQNADTLYVRGYTKDTSSMIIDWVKLEIGSEATTYIQPNESEWDRCIRYDDRLVKGVLYSNPNLLINPDFRINQRGLTSYNTANQYSVDRWKVSKNTVVEVIDNGIHITNDSSYDIYNVFSQQIEWDNNPFDGYITFTAKIKNIKAEPVRIAIYKIDSAGYARLIAQSNTITSDGVYNVSISLGNIEDIVYLSCAFIKKNTGDAVDFEIEWAKLEQGLISTPFTVPDPATELIKCQRYYERLSSARLSIYSWVYEDSILLKGPFMVSKRCTPTVNVLNNEHKFVEDSTNTVFGNISLTKTEISCSKDGIAYLTAKTNMTGLQRGSNMHTDNIDMLEVDAEIY